MRRELLAEDPPRESVRDRGFEAVPDLDPRRAVFERHEEEDAVVVFRLADAPALGQPDGEILDRLLERRDGGDDELNRRALLERGEACGQTLLVGRRQQARLVHDPSGERRQGRLRRRGGRGGDQEPDAGGDPEERARSQRLKSTTGGSSAPSSASK